MKPLLVAILGIAATSAFAAPRPVSDGERMAVQMAADFLHRGPAAIADRLDPNSPLHRFNGQDLLDEIETRVGPPAGARWELQTVVPALANKAAVFGISFPSGVDETATFSLNGDKVMDIQILALPSTRAPLFASADIVENKKATPANALPIGAGIVAALVVIFAAFGRRFSAPASRLAIAAAVAMAIAFLTLHFDDPMWSRASARQGDGLKPISTLGNDTQEPRLATLLPLRRAMTSGTADISAQSTAACHETTCSRVATLWKAQAALQQMETPDVDRSLKQISNVPLAEIVRGRASLLKANEADSAFAFETAMNLGPGRDGLWFETAQALMALGFNDRAERYLRRLERFGSRDAEVYYTLAMVTAVKHREEEAAKYLTRAWKMRPAERADLVAAAPLWSLVKTPSVAEVINLSSPQEATFASSDASSRAIHLPDEAVARISGEFLHVQIKDSELHVSGGAPLAPSGTPVVDAAAWAREEDERGLRDFPQLTSAARTSAALSAPALRRRFTRAADALAKHNRWADLLTLTDGLSPKSEHVPAELFFLRNQALHRLGRASDGQQLITELAASRVLQRRRDADSLQRLAEMFNADDAFDLAVAMYDRAQAIHANPFNDERVRQIQMNKRLATKYSTVRSEHFEVHYPEDVHVIAAKQIDDILEAELKRIQKWVPVPQFSRVVVNVVWWDDFRSTYTGSDFILGFYNGKITVPLAGARRFVPPVVSLMSHELCHAMISQATNDQAPHWFHEGLAQRIEMRPFHANAFNMYDDNHLIAMSLLDPVISTSSDPEIISEGYIESQTVIRYVEATYPNGIRKLLEAFRTGATTEDAIRQLSGKNLADFDTALRAWGRSEARVFENPEPVRYEPKED